MNINKTKDILKLLKKTTTKYPELHIFKEKTPISQPYTIKKKRTKIYQCIYGALSALFLILTGLILVRIPTYSCHQILGDCFSLQGPLATITLLCSSLSFLSLIAIRTEYEVLKHITHKAKNKLHRFYTLKLVIHGMGGLFPFGKSQKKYLNIKCEYHKYLETLLQKRREVSSILDKIGKSSSLSQEQREELYNQALSDGEGQLDEIVELFKVCIISNPCNTPSS